MASERGLKIGDCDPIVELIDVVAEDAPQALMVTAAPEGTSPVERAREATIAQTGADPPPR